MWYGPRHFPRHMRRGPRFPFGIPFVFPFLILFYSHSFGTFIVTMILVGVVFFIIRAGIAATNPGNPRWGSVPNNQGQAQAPYYQPPSQQPVQPQYYQPSYEEGYRSRAQEQQSGETIPVQYDDYEQPMAQYPEQQMPPMQH